MSKGDTVRKRIADLMGTRTQGEFSEAVGVSRSLVSEWLSGVSVPSAPGFLKLAAEATESNPALAPFFWEQAGILPEATLSLADLLLKKGEGKMHTILATAEGMLKERKGDEEQLAREGKVVLVPLWPEDASATTQEPLPLPAFLVPNIASTYYVVAQAPANDAAQRGFAPGDIIVFDSSDELKGQFERLVGEEWLVRLAEGRHRRGGLFIGRAGYIAEGATRHMVLAPFDAPPTSWGIVRLHPPTPFIKLGDSHRRREHVPGVGQPADSEVYDLAECEVLGKFIARLKGEPGPLWKRRARG
jgi:transcriptional regulator with XRE-family HTH domain